MKKRRRWQLLSGVMMLACGVAAFGAVPATAPSTDSVDEVVVLRQVVDDLSEVDPSGWIAAVPVSDSKPADSSWVVARVTSSPAAFGGSMVVHTVEVKILKLISGKMPPENTSFEEKESGIIYSGPRRPAGFSPFEKGSAVVLCRYSEKSAGDERYAPHFVIKEDWIPNIVAASVYWRAHEGILKDPVSHIAELQGMLDDKNAFVRLPALKMLGRLDKLRKEDLDKVLAMGPDEEIAAAVVVVCKANSSLDVKEYLDNRIRLAEKPASLRAIALGYYAEVTFPNGISDLRIPITTFGVLRKLVPEVVAKEIGKPSMEEILQRTWEVLRVANR